MTIYIKQTLESNHPWQSLLPNCKCYLMGHARLILYKDTVYCGSCGKAYSNAGCVGLTLTNEWKEQDGNI